MLKKVSLAVCLGVVLLPLLACGGPTDAEVERAERVRRSRLVGMDSAIRNCEAREQHIYRSFQEAERRAARVDPTRAAAMVQQADRAVAAAEQALAEAERIRDEVTAATQMVERARSDAQRFRAQAARVRAEADVAPVDEADRARADEARERLSELRDLEKRYGGEAHD